MAVQTSLARCLRATQSSTLRPLSIYPVYQRRYASDNSPGSKTPPQSENSILDKLNLGSSTTVQPQQSPTDSTADHAAKLEERMEDIRNKMHELAQPKARVPTRSFFGLPGGGGGGGKASSSRSRPNAEAEAERTLEGLARRAPSSSSSSSSSSSQQQQQQQQQPDYLRQPGNLSSLATSPSSLRNVDEISPPRLKPIAMKLGTKLGRQILVQPDRGVDCAGAIRTLQISCNANGIRRQANLQKFHVRRGQRRKDLRSQRWRKLFKFSFEETVKKIQRMRDQGW